MAVFRNNGNQQPQQQQQQQPVNNPPRQATGALTLPPTNMVDEKAETLIGSSTSIHGSLRAEGTLRIDGMVEGEVHTAGNVIVGRNGKVVASINAQNVMVAGQVRGNVTATHRLEIVASGKVWGDITVASLLIEEGGLFRGQSTMKDDSAADDLYSTSTSLAPLVPTVVSNGSSNGK